MTFRGASTGSAAQLVPVGVSTETKVPGRPKTPLDESDRLALARIASLAAAIMSSLRTPGRGRYDSERQLGEWLSEDGVSYTSADLGPALDLLESPNGSSARRGSPTHHSRVGWPQVLRSSPQHQGRGGSRGAASPASVKREPW
jgi:hypothetical protein